MDKKEKALVLLMRIGLIALSLIGVAACAWYVFHVSLGAYIAQPAESGVLGAYHDLQEALAWIRLIFYWLVSLGCFVIVGILWSVTVRISHGSVFSEPVAKRISVCGKILIADSLALIFFESATAAAGLEPFAVFYIALGVLGLILSLVLFTAAYYDKKAANEISKLTEGVGAKA